MDIVGCISFSFLVITVLCVQPGITEPKNEAYPILHSAKSKQFKLTCGKKAKCDSHNTFFRNNLEMLCFYQMRPPGFYLKCIDTDNRAVEFFAPNRTCEAGFREVADVQWASDSVTLRKEPCPKGYYQPKEGKPCLENCKNKQLPKPPNVEIIKKGTSTSVPIGICKRDYFDVDKLIKNDKILYFGLDMANILCVNRDEFTDLLKCNHSFDVLTNGKCVVPCKEGEVRNPWNGHCGLAGTNTTTGTFGIVNSSTEEQHTDRDASFVKQRQTRSPFRTISTTIANKVKATQQYNGEDQTNIYDVLNAVIIAFVVVATVAVIGVVVYCYCSKKMDREKVSNSQSSKGKDGSIGNTSLSSSSSVKPSSGANSVIKCKTEYGTNKMNIYPKKGATVNINNYGEKEKGIPIETLNRAAIDDDDDDDDVSVDGTIAEMEQQSLMSDITQEMETGPPAIMDVQTDAVVDVEPETEPKEVY